ncbi:MAG: CDP-glycerol glycerophosphotransferase family protein [Polyangiales bacterium]
MSPQQQLKLQNALAVLTLPIYLLLRPLFRLLGWLRKDADGPWVIGGHSGRIYADNPAALHAYLSEHGPAAYFVASSPDLARELARMGRRVVRRNSFAARLALENAAALIESHGPSDLDHVLHKTVKLRGVRIHLNHSMNHLKGGEMLRPRHRSLTLEQQKAAIAAKDPFDFLLASSDRERRNFFLLYPGLEHRIVLGGGAHIDTFLRARGSNPSRSIVYFPTFRESPEANALLDAQIEALASSEALATFLAREDYRFHVVSHVNRRASGAPPTSERFHFASPSDLNPLVLDAEVLVSDYSGILCDFLALDRPTVFFPFDLDDYLQHRSLLVSYGELAWGPEVRDVGSLVELFTSGRFRDREAFGERRAYWEREFFPHLAPTYTKECAEMIERLVTEHAKGTRREA